MKQVGKQVILSFVLLVVGFLITFSYQLTNSKDSPKITAKQWEKEYALRDQSIELEERTRDLQKELYERQQEIREMEQKLAHQEKTFFNLVEDVEKLRMFAGTVKVKGPGIEVTLSDASYVKSEANANNYIVHESHIHKVVNELLSSGGANAIAINGQRLLHNSYISCVGPVISVDGNEYNAPFVISAIGDPEFLNGVLNIQQGVKDQLVMDNIQVKIEKKERIIIEPYLEVSEDQI